MHILVYYNLPYQYIENMLAFQNFAHKFCLQLENVNQL